MILTHVRNTDNQRGFLQWQMGTDAETTARHYIELKLEFFIKSLPLRTLGIQQNRRWKDVKAREDRGHQKNREL